MNRVAPCPFGAGQEQPWLLYAGLDKGMGGGTQKRGASCTTRSHIDRVGSVLDEKRRDKRDGGADSWGVRS